MCGHVGIAGKLEFRDEATMKRLLLLDFFRGPDSTGFAAYRNNGDVKLVKYAVDPITLFGIDKFKDALNGNMSQVFLGHNRLATKGVVNNFNAHPYQFGKIVGAHNGTLDKSSWDALEKALDEKFPVDSMAIIAAIDRLGIEETVSMLSGAWALVWFDTEEKTINFLRNKERPLWYSYTSDFSKLIWASQHHMIHAGIGMSEASQKYELYQDEKSEHKYQFFQFQEDWWYKFSLDAFRATGEKSRPKAKVKLLKGKEAAKSQHSPFLQTTGPRPGFSPAAQTGSHTTTRQHLMNSTTPSHGRTSTTTSEKVHLLHEEIGEDPYNYHVDKKDFEYMTHAGCSWCGSEIAYGDQGITVYEVHDVILCKECSSPQEVTRIHADPLNMDEYIKTKEGVLELSDEMKIAAGHLF